MLHRIFLAVNLPEAVKKELLSYKEKYSELPARWAAPENLHLTLVFCGNVSEKELEEIKMKTKEVVQKHKPFTFKLSRITYGPNAHEPRMIWATGDMPKELLVLQRNLAETLLRGSTSKLESLHITLARLKEFEFRRIEPEERPEINDAISLDILAQSVDIMESKLKRSGAEYTLIENCKLQTKNV